MESVIAELEVVLHVDFGGFRINDEMALWLMENRGWIIDKTDDWRDDCPLNHLYESGQWIWSPHNDSIAFRSHPDLIACVRALKERHKDDSYPDSIYGHIHGLAIQKVIFKADIEDYHDGKEKVNGWVNVD